MKNPSDLTEAEETDSASAPQPFNLFAGLSEEQLPTTAAHAKVPAALVPPAQTQRTAEEVPTRGAAFYWAMAVIAVLIVIVLAFL
jgi:hypothetical protein